jgi:Putative amidoligase enzyme
MLTTLMSYRLVNTHYKVKGDYNMLPIKLKDGVAAININASRKLTSRQLATFQRTKDIQGDSAADSYLYTLLGLSKEHVSIRRPCIPSYVEDNLAMKPLGTIMSMFRELQVNDEDVMHLPSKRSPGQWVGVEIECYYPAEKECTDDCDHNNNECMAEFYPSESEAQQTVRNALIKAGVTRSCVKDDGSLDSEDGVGIEVTLLFNAEYGYDQLEKTCQVLNDLGCFVNKQCGLHVHLDMRHLNSRRVGLIGKRLGRALPILKWIVDPSRHDNHYCKLEVGPLTRGRDNRYYAVNMQAFTQYGTIEVRMHGGSTNGRKIKNWVELLRFIASSRIPKPLTTFQDLIDLGIGETLTEYAEKRISKLNPDAWTTLIPPTPLLDGP